MTDPLAWSVPFGYYPWAQATSGQCPNCGMWFQGTHVCHTISPSTTGTPLPWPEGTTITYTS